MSLNGNSNQDPLSSKASFGMNETEESSSGGSSNSSLASLDSDEQSLGPRTVLVTGGAGFIGSHTAEALLELGDKVVVIDEMNDYYDLEQKKANVQILRDLAAKVGKERGMDDMFSYYEGDICDRELMVRIFRDQGITHVCHLAARAGVRPSIEDPYIYIQSNIMGTVSLMELAAQHKVENFVYASSSSVYGGSKNEQFAESDIVDEPVSQYAATKKACELFAATYNSLYGLNCTGLRFFTVYGPRGRPDMAPFKFMHRILNGISIDQYGDGTSERDYTYISDIVDGILLAIDKPQGNVVFNLGRGTPCRLTKFISTIEDICGRKAIINMMPMQPGDVPRTCSDTSKAERVLGYEPSVSLEEGLRATMDWYSEWQSVSRLN